MPAWQYIQPIQASID